MSRSYKKFPWVKDRDSSKWGKKYCNKQVRKVKDIPNGCAYKKIAERWDYIYDYGFYETWEEYQQYCKNPRWYGQEPEEPVYFDWYKMYKMK